MQLYGKFDFRLNSAVFDLRRNTHGNMLTLFVFGLETRNVLVVFLTVKMVVDLRRITS